jgi:2-polyprenyl-6-methoxyphenol hydroxylase-like FAD-dependent oxidoreductase
MTHSRSRPVGTALVVGAGPVGLTAAAELTRHGIACRIIDKCPAPTDKSKALVVWGRTLEILDDMGAAPDFVAAGMFAAGAGVYRDHGKPLVRITFDRTDTAYPRPLMIAQSETERLLGEHLTRLGVTVERPVELTDLAAEDDQVVATLRHANGLAESVRFDWLIGCDGAHSTVRKKVGIEFAGEFEPNDWILADVRIDGPIAHDEVRIDWHSEGVLAFFPFGRDRFRVIADLGMARGTDHPADPTLADAQAVVDRRGPAGLKLTDPVWLAGFRIHERKVAEYRRGRVALAGDAAHIHSPAGGQGMNTGMHDAYNLAWKVALTQSGRARPLLMDSYSQERGAVGDMVLRQAGRMTRMATLRNPVLQFVRNRVAGVLGQLPAFRRGITDYLTEFAVHYPKSPLNGEAPGHAWRGGALPGDRLPDAPLRRPSDGGETRLLRELSGTTHELLLLATSTDPGELRALAAVGRDATEAFTGLLRTHLILPASSVPTGVSGADCIWLDANRVVSERTGARATAVLLARPDGYVGFRGGADSADALLEHLGQYLVPADAAVPRRH